MTQHLSHIGLWVRDQDEAITFYTQKLGFEVRSDVTVAELGNFRWLTVGPPGQQVRDLMAKGFAGAVFLTTDDCRASYEELKARGVEFTEEPEERPYGIDCGLRDPSGNSLRLTQVNEAVVNQS